MLNFRAQNNGFMSSKRFLFSCLCLFFFGVMSNNIIAQKKELSYYLPQIEFNEEIPTPEEYLGYQIGEWHISHDQLIGYCKILAEKSDRVTLKEYARSHENRPLINLIFSHPKNQSNLDSLRKRHLQISDEGIVKNVPLVLYQGYSIHGNEPSGANAAALVAYYLAAGKSKTIDKLLKEDIVIIDPCYNPDGLQRFSTWVNMHRSANLNPDENDREFSEEWPGGRTNHYWFDLNRDWLLLVHPESKGRIKNYHFWKPNVLTDHHEMGKNSTFFFQPGVPSRTNPNTPQRNQDLTEEIAQFHMKALDAIGSKYFMKKRFDDFYYGKGSTYPDANGAIGILFEQASSRGHLQERNKGVLSFPFTIRNQVVTSLSTQAAAIKMRDKLIKYQAQFYKNAKIKAQQNSIKGYVFHDNDNRKIQFFLDRLKSHKVKFSKTVEEITKEKTYPVGSYVVPMDQKEYTLAKTIFEPVSAFGDSIFYDVSAWTMPMAFDLNYTSLNASELSQITSAQETSVKTKDFETSQRETSSPFHKMYLARKDTLHEDHKRLPKIALLVGDGVYSNNAGEVWHHFDKKHNIPITKIDIHQFKNSERLNKYNTLIMVNGRYGELDSTRIEFMKEWIYKGGKLICFGSALRWAQKHDLLDITFKKRKVKDTETDEYKYVSTEVSRNANVIGGAIFETKMDLDHPLCKGYEDNIYYSFKQGTHFLEKPKSRKVEVVLNYTNKPRKSGYVSKGNEKLIANSPCLVRQQHYNGAVIGFVDNPVFRGYWFAGEKLLMNAVFE